VGGLGASVALLGLIFIAAALFVGVINILGFDIAVSLATTGFALLAAGAVINLLPCCLAHHHPLKMRKKIPIYGKRTAQRSQGESCRDLTRPSPCQPDPSA
jgi:hypothetical protein